MLSVSTQKESRSKDSGFTLIEIVLVVVIIGVMLVVIIPRANRARDAAKFNSIRQVSSELALWGMTWAERNLKVQPEDAESELIDYVDTLQGFVGNEAETNWMGDEEADRQDVVGRNAGTGNPKPVNVVKEIMPQDKVLRNPFTGMPYFNAANAAKEQGVIELVSAPDDDDYINFYLIFYVENDDGTFSPYGLEITDSPTTDTFDADALNAVRSGVFMARLK